MYKKERVYGLMRKHQVNKEKAESFLEIELQFLQAKFDLVLWRKNGSTSFKAKLYQLFCKADCNNTKKLSQAFPVEYAAYKSWYESENEDDWCDKVLGDYTKWEKEKTSATA